MNRPVFSSTLASHGFPPLRSGQKRILQVNLGRKCDLACQHCHVEAGPARTETLSPAAADRILALLAAHPQLITLDLTGGAPELSREFRRLVTGARRLGREVIDRCNLTVLHEPGQEDTAQFLAVHDVRIVASLPCYTLENVDAQRGRGVFDRSIESLKTLNALGYAEPGSNRFLDLVYNPLGASLPPAQAELEARYRAELQSLFGIRFNRLFTITNMPIKRFAHSLERDGQHETYMSLLADAFNPATVPGLMCRDTLSVGWNGTLHDCDFNQMLELPLPGPIRGLFELDDLGALDDAPIATAAHCFGCTAGAGSSCGGTLAPSDRETASAAAAESLGAEVS
ncbi:MAG: arsenosugar biosynthesis radical SAM protein ArsS [Deltaproteobacteria bacterium]|nr:arsenosugar biosynthesis radical SAM protein ArsS [Deltaproteobacteria bacterium]MBW2362295.1 arsenosugar biosynthesis radical SAM protein ArsS [Deltaproteobacteria bacterium]